MLAPQSGHQQRPRPGENGEGGIRTRDGVVTPYSLSRRVPSATRPPLPGIGHASLEAAGRRVGAGRPAGPRGAGLPTIPRACPPRPPMRPSGSRDPDSRERTPARARRDRSRVREAPRSAAPPGRQGDLGVASAPALAPDGGVGAAGRLYALVQPRGLAQRGRRVPSDTADRVRDQRARRLGREPRGGAPLGGLGTAA
jgi:hypothetical protein